MNCDGNCKCKQESAIMTSPLFTYNEWIEYGISNGFCSRVVCEIHDGAPITETEGELFDAGLDPCAFIVRLGTETSWEEDAVAMKSLIL
jgi:hypothetical protein